MKKMFALHVVVLSLALCLAIPNYTAQVYAIPSLTPHEDSDATIEWELDGVEDGSSAHNHRSPRSFDQDPLYDANKVWDNRHIRVDFTDPFNDGHGYIDESATVNVPRYYFSSTDRDGNPVTWNANAKNLISQALDRWSAITSDRANLITGIEFSLVTGPPAEIVMYWEDLPPPNLGITESGVFPVRVIFDSSPPQGGWYYNVDPSGTPTDQYHFFSTALHETGHVVGLADQTDNDDVMIASRGPGPSGPCFSAIDADSTEGVRDLYSIPIPTLPGKKGSMIDRNRFKVIRSPDAQVLAMLTREIDFLTRVSRPGDIENLQDASKTISSTPGFHIFDFVFNLRSTFVAGPNAGLANPLADINFRHALFHLMPKSRIIGTQFRYIVSQLDTMVPPAMAEWYNSYVDPHPFSDPATLGENAESVKILKAAGYLPVGSWPYTAWTFSDGTPLPTLRVYAPLESVVPGIYQTSKMWTDQIHLIGLNNVVNSPEEVSPALIRTYNLWDFEIAWNEHQPDRFPDYLYEMLHSSENYQGSSNPHGIYWPALDQELYKLKTSLDHAEKVAAAKKAQELVAGGTPSSPLPYPYPSDGPYKWSLARLPVYSKNYYDVQQPELRGAVNMRGQGIDTLRNPLTAMNIYWSVDPATIGRVDPDGSVFYINMIDEYPERLNVLWSKTVYAAIFYQCYEGLIAVNPWTHTDMPWLATDWEYKNVTGEPGYPAGTKQYVKFWLRGDVSWQDGTAFTVDDVRFAWLFLRDWQIPKYYYFTHYIIDVDTDPVENSVTAYMSRTSQWDLYDLASTAAMLPRIVWANNPVTGNPWADVTEILSFDPAQTWVGGPLPTYLYGTGPFIFQFYDTSGAYGDLDANRNYWLTTEEIQDLTSYYFWRSGDTDVGGRVYAEDMGAIGINWGATGVPLGPPGPDITGYLGAPPDGNVDVDDLLMAAINFGETISVPYP